MKRLDQAKSHMGGGSLGNIQNDLELDEWKLGSVDDNVSIPPTANERTFLRWLKRAGAMSRARFSKLLSEVLYVDESTSAILRSLLSIGSSTGVSCPNCCMPAMCFRYVSSLWVMSLDTLLIHHSNQFLHRILFECLAWTMQFDKIVITFSWRCSPKRVEKNCCGYRVTAINGSSESRSVNNPPFTRSWSVSTTRPSRILFTITSLVLGDPYDPCQEAQDLAVRIHTNEKTTTKFCACLRFPHCQQLLYTREG